MGRESGWVRKYGSRVRSGQRVDRVSRSISLIFSIGNEENEINNLKVLKVLNFRIVITFTLNSG